ncbi:MAG: endonuclease/exonuclease/phosphatase family protein [Bacteroidota bacterium]
MMKASIKGLLFGLLSLAYSLLLGVCLAGLLAPFLPITFLPEAQLMAAFLTFFLPLHLLFLWVALKRKATAWVLLGLLGLASSLFTLSKDVNWNRESLQPQSDELLKVVSFNVGTFDYDAQRINEVADLLTALDPDVVTFQEFRNHKLGDGRPALDYMAKALNMPHRHFVHLPVHIHGAATFSRYPITQLDTLFMPTKEINSGILTTLKTPLGKVGVGNLHLSSYHLAQTLDQNRGWQNRFGALRENGGKVLRLQQEKVDLVLRKTDSYPYPLVLTGDFNAPPHSRIATQFSRRYQDSFYERGQGLGWTFHIWRKLGVRIDYQYASPHLHILDHQVVPTKSSDHYPLLVSYELLP